MKPLYSCTAAMLMILAGVALFRPHVMKARPGSGSLNLAPAPTAIPAPKMHLAENYGKLPLSFEANQGQTDGRVKFLSRGRGYSLFLTGDEAVLTLGSVSQNAKVKAGVTPTGVRSDLQRSANGDVVPTFWSAYAGLKPGATTAIDSPKIIDGPRTTDSVFRMKLIGANASAAVTGADELPGKSNYFIGNDPKKWRTNVPNFAKVKYQDVYPGVDLVYYGNQGGQLEYDFVVAPGADPDAIRLALSGDLEVGSRQTAVGRGTQNQPLHKSKIQNLKSKIDADGDLVVKTEGGEVRFHKPIVYQPDLPSTASSAGSSLITRHSSLVGGHYTLDAQNHVRFQVAPYDHSKTLFIDPLLAYSTYLGGSGGDGGQGIAVDSAGNAYVTGETASTDFPTVNPYQATNHNNFEGTAFVAKLNAAGSHLVYSTYLGGSGSPGAIYNEAGSGIAVDSSGNAYVTGYTASGDFPTVNPFQATCGGGCYKGTAFVTKLNAAGSGLVFSTFLGGSNGEYGSGIAVDSSGNAYATGQTSSSDFPTANPFQAACGGGCTNGTAFVTKFNAVGSALVFSTFLGGSGGDVGRGIAVDASHNAYVTGLTGSTDFPTANPFQATCGGGCLLGTAFVTKLNAAGTGLVFSTYLGGSGGIFGEYGSGIAADSSGNAYVTGLTSSTDFPTANPFQTTCGGGCMNGTAFVTKLNAAGSALVYSTYLGGSGSDQGYGIAVDSSGNAYVTGTTNSLDFPTTGNAYQATNQGGYDAFLTEFDATGTTLVYSTYLGGSAIDDGYGIALNTGGNAYVTGLTYSTDFPTANPVQAACGGGCNYGTAFVANLFTGGPALALIPNLIPLWFLDLDVGVTSMPVIETVTNPGGAALSISSIVATGDFAQTNTCRDPVPAGGRCTISITFTPTAIGTRTGVITITDNAPGSPQTIALSGLGVLPTMLGPTSLTFGNQAENTTSPPQTVTLTNTQSTPLAISITTSPDFGQTNTCGGTVPAMSRCTISVTYTPIILGVEAGRLTVLNANGGLLQTASLSGRGVVQALISPSSLWFTPQTVGSPSAAMNVMLANNLSTALPISPITFTGLNAGDFAETDTCGGSVAAKSSCTISVTFTPRGIGPRMATMTINDSASNSPQAVGLNGAGESAVVPAVKPE